MRQSKRLPKVPISILKSKWYRLESWGIELEGKVGIVAGAAGGMGKAIAKKLG